MSSVNKRKKQKKYVGGGGSTKCGNGIYVMKNCC